MIKWAVVAHEGDSAADSWDVLSRDEAPTHVAVAFDVGRKTFRTEAYAEYKATRKETPTD